MEARVWTEVGFSNLRNFRTQTWIRIQKFWNMSGVRVWKSDSGHLCRKHGLATFVHERLEWSLVNQSPEQSETERLSEDVEDTRPSTSTNLHARDSHLRPSRRSHNPVSMLATSTANMSTEATANIPWRLELGRLDNSQQPWTAVSCMTQKKQSVPPLCNV